MIETVKRRSRSKIARAASCQQAVTSYRSLPLPGGGYGVFWFEGDGLRLSKMLVASFATESEADQVAEQLQRDLLAGGPPPATAKPAHGPVEDDFDDDEDDLRDLAPEEAAPTVYRAVAGQAGGRASAAKQKTRAMKKSPPPSRAAATNRRR